MPQASANLVIVQGAPVRGSSANNQVATLKEVTDSNGTKFDVVPMGTNCQWTTIDLSNGRGGKDSVVTKGWSRTVPSILRARLFR